ncbi:MAG TPA: DUF2461 domain-containing protein [Acidimicrobiales bacterium]|nr:DUF2461 domain-containing protein [Acidimicrobiales bacterium]
MAFRGWPAEAIEFFEGLEADNTKAYWQDHKADYEKNVRGPMDELLAELAKDFGEGKVFRPYRDVRFSADKSPYKTNIAATVATGGYISLSSEGLGVGSGYYMPMPDQLERFRAAVADNKTGPQLEKLVEASRKAGLEVAGHDALKTAPKGYPKDHPRIELLRQKGLITWKQWPVAAWLGTAKAKQRIVDVFVAARPLNSWLDKHIGPSTAPERY